MLFIRLINQIYHNNFDQKKYFFNMINIYNKNNMNILFINDVNKSKNCYLNKIFEFFNVFCPSFMLFYEFYPNY